jgi:hypothetical protein
MVLRLSASGGFRASIVRIAALLVAAVVFACATGADAAPIVRVDGKTLAVRSMLRHGFVFVPIRGVFERLHASVRYRRPGTVSVAKFGREIVRMHMGSHRALVDGRPTWSPAAPFRSHGHIFVPLRLIGQAAGAVVAYQSQLVEIRNGAPRPAVHRVAHRSHPQHVVSHARVIAAAPIPAAVVATVPDPDASSGTPWWVWLLVPIVLVAIGAAVYLLRFRRHGEHDDPVIRTRAPIEVGTPPRQ